MPNDTNPPASILATILAPAPTVPPVAPPAPAVAPITPPPGVPVPPVAQPAPAVAPITPPPGIPVPPAARYPLDDRRLAELDNRFEYHAPKGDQVARYAAIRAKARELALVIVQNTPFSREQALAMTHVDEAMMFANAAIARGE